MARTTPREIAINGTRAMKDRIIASYLTDFIAEFGLRDLSEAEAFEYFVNYCVVSKHHPDAFEPDDVAVGGSGDLGLDGLGILVNDHLVSSREDVDHLKKALRRLDVQFIFVQSKTSPRFDAADVGAVFAGVREFFKPSLPRDVNDRIRELHDIKEHIFDFSIDMDRNPAGRLYYATTGVWNDRLPVSSRRPARRICTGRERRAHAGRRCGSCAVKSRQRELRQGTAGISRIYENARRRCRHCRSAEAHRLLLESRAPAWQA